MFGGRIIHRRDVIYCMLGFLLDMKSLVLKRSVVIAGHKTSVSLEDPFWRDLKAIATARNLTLSDLVGTIDADRTHANLSSAIRLFILNFYSTRGRGSQLTDPARQAPLAPDL